MSDSDSGANGDLYAGFATLTRDELDNVERLTLLRGANGDETEHRIFDDIDAEILLGYAPDLARMLARAGKARKGRSAAEQKRIAASHRLAQRRTDRMARELVSRIWEDARVRSSGETRLPLKWPDQAAWSPAALDTILDRRGRWRRGTPWKGALVQEHVVPATTIAKIIAALHAKKAHPAQVAEALRESIHQVVVKYGTTPAGRRDQPKSGVMAKDMEDKLIAHHTGADRLDSDELFMVTWSRYLDPNRRGTDGRELDWRLTQLRTVTATLGVPLEER